MSAGDGAGGAEVVSFDKSLTERRRYVTEVAPWDIRPSGAYVWRGGAVAMARVGWGREDSKDGSGKN